MKIQMISMLLCGLRGEILGKHTAHCTKTKTAQALMMSCTALCLRKEGDERKVCDCRKNGVERGATFFPKWGEWMNLYWPTKAMGALLFDSYKRIKSNGSESLKSNTNETEETKDAKRRKLKLSYLQVRMNPCVLVQMWCTVRWSRTKIKRQTFVSTYFCWKDVLLLWKAVPFPCLLSLSSVNLTFITKCYNTYRITCLFAMQFSLLTKYFSKSEHESYRNLNNNDRIF